jgi:ribosome biogenesis ATPase
VEVEVASEKTMRVGLVDGGTESSKGRNGGGGGGGGGGGRGGGGGEVVKGEEGPRFRDLGGMEGLLEELRMEVIVPLYHPQLPRWLGVRPMAGILLHGPPGCGKTKLAHAIANETGVPFYKISATEVVSGVSGIYFSLSIVFSRNSFVVISTL